MSRDDPRYPLQWPFGWKRTDAADRVRSGFTEKAMVSERFYNSETLRNDIRQKKGTKTVGLRTACDRLQDQLERLQATNVTLSTNVELTLGGEPRADRKAPDDTGAAVYFVLNGNERVLACDRYHTVAENVAALANHIDCLRRVERYGVGTLEQAFTGYGRLPPPSADNRAPWRAVLQFAPTDHVNAAIMQARYKSLAKMIPVDAADYNDRLRDLNLAREAALREFNADRRFGQPHYGHGATQ